MQSTNIFLMESLLFLDPELCIVVGALSTVFLNI
jgi:hypothetical protein